MDPNEAQEGKGSAEHKKEDKNYIKSKAKWKDFNIHNDIIEALNDQQLMKPTRVQEETLKIVSNPERKKFNILIRASNGAGKTMCFLLPLLNSLEPGLKIAEDKLFKGKVLKNELFKPQGIILVQTNILQEQLFQILKLFQSLGEARKSQKLKFTVGKLDKEAHEPADIIICQPKSFFNRHQRGNMNLQHCKFVAIDEIDEIFISDKPTLREILKIIGTARPSLIVCSATMQNEFLDFFQECVKYYITVNINKLVEEQVGERISLEGVRSYYKTVEDSNAMYKYVINVVFKHLYEKVEKKPQVFIFFNSIDQIQQFDQIFKSLASDFTTDEAKYLSDLKVGKIAAKQYVDGKKEDTTIKQKRDLMTEFKNNETNILLCTNIMARGIDIRNACFVINIGAPKSHQKSNEIDFDIYLHRVGRTGRHNDKGIALTLTTPNQIEVLKPNVEKIHKIVLMEMQDPAQLAEQVKQCIKDNS